MNDSPLSEAKRMLADAQRYRWLRKHQHYLLLEQAFGYSYAQIEHWSNEQNFAKLDAAVDIARETERDEE